MSENFDDPSGNKVLVVDGDEIVLNRDTDREVRLRIVAALADSVLQSELVVSEAQVRRVFPEQEGFNFFMIDIRFFPNLRIPVVVNNHFTL